MNTTVSREGPTRVRLTINVPADEIKPAVDRAFKYLAGQIKVPGFRPGKVPRKILETRIGADEIKDVIVREAVPQFYSEAVVAEKIEPVAQPHIDITNFDESEGLAFEAVVEVRPEIELPDLSGLTVTRPAWQATPEELDQQIERMRDRYATLEPVTRPGTDGDYAQIDIKGYWNDQEIENATANDMLYEIGSGGIVEELDSEIRGKSIGDILKFNATLPAHFGAEWGGKEVSFQVLVKEIRQKNMPALDDEFAKTASEFDTLEELKADLSERIGAIKKGSAEAEVRSRILEKLVETVNVVAPDALVEEEIAARTHRLSDQLRQAGVGLDDYLTTAETTEEQVEADIRKQAERSVRAQLLLEEIARREELKIEEDELALEIARIAQAGGVKPEEAAKRLRENGRIPVIAGDILRRKALEFLADKADITDEVAASE